MERYIVEIRPARQGERFLSAAATTITASRKFGTWPLCYPVIVQDLSNDALPVTGI